MNERRSAVRRTVGTKETDITISVSIDGTGRCAISTGINFLDHMMTALAKHSMIDLDVDACGRSPLESHLTGSSTT